MRALRSRTVQSDSESNDQIMEESEHVTEEIISKKDNRLKSKKHTSDSESTEHVMENLKCAAVSKKVKRRKPKMHPSDRKSNEHIMEDSEHGTETDTTVPKKLKRKKTKKHTSDIEINEHKVQDSEHGTESETTLPKKLKRKNIKKHISVIEINEHMMVDSEHGTETETTISKKVKRKKSKKHTSYVNDPDSEKVPEEQISKKKNKKLKKQKTHIDSSFAVNETGTVSNISTETQEVIENPSEKMVKIKSRKPREFLRSTIFNIPNFDNAVTSTVMKPKRPEIKFEESEINDGFENKSLQKINKLKKSKSEHKSRKHSKIIEGNKTDFDMETDISIVPSKTSVETKRSTFSICNTIEPDKTYKIEDSFEKNSPNKSKKQESFQKRTKIENTLTCNRDSVSNRRETFNIIPKNQISNGIDSVIAISDSFNKSNLFAPDITSDEEIITDDSLEQKSLAIEENKRISESNRRETFNKLPKDKILHDVENTVINISDSSEGSNLKQNTFNKSEAQDPEVTSDESNDTNEIPNKINESIKSTSPDQSLNCKKTKKSLGLRTHNDTFIGRKDSFCKTPINASSRKSEEIYCEVNNLLDEENNKEYLEGLSDVSESILDNVIDISISPEKTKLKRSTFNLSSTNNTINKPDLDIKQINDTFDVKLVNTSGDWQVEKSQVDSSTEDVDQNLNDTFDIGNKENNSQNSNTSKGNSTIIVNNENISLSPTDKSFRKKWLKFPRHSTDAQIVLDQISSPKLQKKMKIVEKIMNTPSNLYKVQKQSIAPSNLSIQSKSFQKSPLKSIKKSPLKSTKKSPLKSIRKSAIKSIVNENSTKKSASKRTIMPNFALIHKKAFEKMENLAEYSERKKQRAQKLLSLNKTGSKRKSLSKLHKEKTEETKAKSSRQLFTNDPNKYNRFGFKITDPTKKPTINQLAKPTTQVAIVKPVNKPSVFARSEIVAIANKNKTVTNNRENRRDMLKGVRTNRRFELLMQMRNK